MHAAVYTEQIISHRIMTDNVLSEFLPGAFTPYPNLETLVLNNNAFTTVSSEGLDIPQLTSL